MQKSHQPADAGAGSAVRRHRSAAWLLLALLLMLGSMLAQHANSSTVVPSEAGAGELYWRSAEGTGYEPALHLGSEVVMDVRGLNAAVSVEQTFTNNTDRWLEGVYVFPLPENSAVNRMRITIGGRVIEGKIREKQEARKTYQQARSTGHRAALVEQERPNLFTQSVANIGPGETLKVELGYLQTLHFDKGVFSLRFPMTLTPRYIPGQPLLQEPIGTSGWAMPTDSVPDAHRITPHYRPDRGINPVRLTVLLDAGLPLADVASDTHDIRVDSASTEPGRKHITLAPGAGMDRDFELRWRPQPDADATAAVFHEQHQGEHFVQLMLVPPDMADNAKTLPREMILVVDVSGSMQGTSMEQARHSLLWALDQLRPDDRFNIIAFESNHQSLYAKPLPASFTHLEQARRFVRGLRAGGGTEMAPALREALSQRSGESKLRQLVFITDGSVGNESELFSLIHTNLDEARLFTVGIGSAPNSYFMRKAAEFGRGTFTHIGDLSQVSERMAALFEKLSHPVMASVELQWPGAVQAETFPSVIPDLYLGEPLMITARLPRDIAGQTIIVSGQVGGHVWQRQLPVPAVADSGKVPVATSWARKKIAALLDEKVRGGNPETLRAEVLKLALAYRLLSPYTSFIAVEETPSRPVNEGLDSEAVLNQLPHGQSAPALMFPQTATPASLQMLTGLLALLLLWVIRRGLGHE